MDESVNREQRRYKEMLSCADLIDWTSAVGQLAVGVGQQYL